MYECVRQVNLLHDLMLMENMKYNIRQDNFGGRIMYKMQIVDVIRL